MLSLGSLCLHAAHLMKHSTTSKSGLEKYGEDVGYGLIGTTEKSYNGNEKSENEYQLVTLTSVEVRSTVSDDMAKVKIIQVYENQSEEVMDVQYGFPIHPDGGTFMNFKADIDGVSVRDVSKHEIGDEEDHISSGVSAGIIEFLKWIVQGNKPAIFKIPICSMNPGSSVQIRLGYEYKLHSISNVLRFLIPKAIVPKISANSEKYIEGNNTINTSAAAQLSIKVNISIKGLIDSLESPSHPGILVVGKFEDPTSKGRTQAQIKFSGDSTDMVDDFVLLIKKSEVEVNDNNGNQSAEQMNLDQAPINTSSSSVLPKRSKQRPKLDDFGGVIYEDDSNVNIRKSEPRFVRGSVDYSIMKTLESSYIASKTSLPTNNVAKETEKPSKDSELQLNYESSNNTENSEFAVYRENIYPDTLRKTKDLKMEDTIAADEGLIEDPLLEASVADTEIDTEEDIAVQSRDSHQLTESQEESFELEDLKESSDQKELEGSSKNEELPGSSNNEELQGSSKNEELQESSKNEELQGSSQEAESEESSQLEKSKRSSQIVLENQDQFIESFQSFHDKAGTSIESKKSIVNIDDSTSVDADQNNELLVVENTDIATSVSYLEDASKNKEDKTTEESKSSKLILTNDKPTAPPKKFNFSQPRTTKLQISRANLIAKTSSAVLSKPPAPFLNDKESQAPKKTKTTTSHRKPSPISTNHILKPLSAGVNRTPSYSSTLKKPATATREKPSSGQAAIRSPSLDRKKVTFANANPPKPLVSDKDVSKILINLQTPNGSFELSPILTALLSQDLDNIRQVGRDKGWADTSVATAMSLAFFTTKLGDHKSAWNSSFEKGQKWLLAHFPKKADQIMEYMNENIFHE